jgi:hypothetical protein
MLILRGLSDPGATDGSSTPWCDSSAQPHNQVKIKVQKCAHVPCVVGVIVEYDWLQVSGLATEDS